MAAGCEALAGERLQFREEYGQFVSTRESIARSATQVAQKKQEILRELLQIFPITSTSTTHTRSVSIACWTF